MMMALRMLWAWLTGQRLVALQDYDNEVTWAFAFPTPFGWMAKRHWPFNIANVTLLPDGTCKGMASYVKRWWSAEPLPASPFGERRP